MGRIVAIISLLCVVFIVGCSSGLPGSVVQTICVDSNTMLYLCWENWNYTLCIQEYGRKDICPILDYDYNEPYIFDVVDDIIIIRYHGYHSPNEPDTCITMLTKELSVDKHKRYIVKEEIDYSYNGNAIGMIQGRNYDHNYYYYIDSISHISDEFHFYIHDSLIYNANQNAVHCIPNSYPAKYKAYYIDSAFSNYGCYDTSSTKRYIMLKEISFVFTK